jgi:hypothetical protein
MWEQNYLAYAIDRASKQGFTGGLAHRDAIAKFQLMLFNSDPAYPRLQGAPYIVGVGVPPAGGVNYTDYNSFTFYTTPAQLWSATAGNERPFAGYYGPEARLNLMMGIEAGWSGAQAAYDYLWPAIGSTNTFCASFGPDKPDLACRAGWALASLSTTAPAPVTAPARLLSPAAGSTLSSSSQTFTWDPGLGVTGYRLDVGTTQGASNLFASGAIAGTSATVVGLPTNGSTIWVRLSSSIGGSSQFVDYSFVTFTVTVVTAPAGPGTITVRSAVFADGIDTVTAGPFSTAPGDLVIAFVGNAGTVFANQTIVVSGGGLTWTRVILANGTPGRAEVWRALSPGALSNISVTSTPSAPGFSHSLSVLTFAGAEGVGASASASSDITVPSVSITTTRVGSLIYGVGNDWDSATARTLGPNQSMVHEFLSPTTFDSYWLQRYNTPAASVGTVVVLNDTAPLVDRWNFAAVEIIPALGHPADDRANPSAITVHVGRRSAPRS